MLVPVSSQPSSQANDDMHLISLWLQGKSSRSQEAYSHDIEQFVDFVDVPLSDVKLQHFWDWVDHLKEKGALPATQARKLAAVKSLFSFAHRIGYLLFNVGAAVTLPNIPEKLSERILTEADIQQILAQASTLRNRVLLKLFYASGARVSELSRLYWGAVIARNDNQQGQITLLGKGNKTRTLVVPTSVWKELMELKSKTEATEPNQPVFRSRKGGPLSRQQIWRIVRNAAKSAGFDQNISPHWLRHAHASHALNHGAPVHLVKESLGHQSLTTTSKYAHARPDESSSKYIDI
ncbi:MAG: tyrosine-type recombinase/integrase [Rhodothermaceae bacterium]|nr:tyrosine-type recombinase/integrase [Bacteroidota bacterium]MXW13671.1 tyrosine-type recombinase/integrase [Rhodothermaceae bacterium]MDE2644525.1 tyrosine-type recombinase/integrase [Bacteroidota bacterium]MXW33357.1 tyrosine-type recombinase/integrase [Rhodothermaceae bacterium]MXX96178.1 tyrosine-type recombinase/integrase [Rhodothermaceae bacterium]